MMGIIMMLGIVVSNGVLLVDYTNVLRGEGGSYTTRQSPLRGRDSGPF
jgi:Cation/multidrug efflux pump